jgi:acyl dehydratase
MRDLLGKEGEPEHFEVEKGHIKRFAHAIGDPNPLWTDMDYALKSSHHTIIAPPLFLIDSSINKLADKLMALKGPLDALINAGTEIDYYKAIEVGDTITTTAKLIDLKEKTGSNGKLLIMLTEMTYRNQKGELVRRCRNTFIRSERK